MIKSKKIAHFLLLIGLSVFGSATLTNTVLAASNDSSVSTPETQTPGNHKTPETGSAGQVLEACGDRDDCFSKAAKMKINDNTNPGHSAQEVAAREAAAIANGSYKPDDSPADGKGK